MSSAAADHEATLAALVGSSDETRRLRDRVRALAPLRVAVLVSGEPGAGHDHVVRQLHGLSRAAPSALVRVSTRSRGARRLPRPGASYHLEEVGGFSLSEQLHWFDNMSRSGDGDGGFRVFASTSHDLAALVRSGDFHGAFAERLLRFEVRIAPLRDRPEDIPPLVVHLADRIGGEMGRSRVRIAPAAMTLLAAAPWPGNVCELSETVAKLVAFSPEGDVTAERVREVLGDLPDSVAVLRQQRRDRQREELVEMLEACGGNLAEVARRLEISRGAVIYRAQKFGLLPRRGKLGTAAPGGRS